MRKAGCEVGPGPGRIPWTRTGGRACGVTGQQGTYPAEAVILATGGVSYPATGSTGDGYRMAAALGHEIVPPCGSLVPLVSGDRCLSPDAGPGPEKRGADGPERKE